MKIERSSLHPTTVPKRKDKTRAGDGSFAGNLAGAGGATGAPDSGRSAGVSGPASLLALQEVPDATSGRERARQRGERLLARLEELRDGLLMGRMKADTVRRLADEVDQARGEIDDPQLSDILDEIELRAQVELAKLRR
jgi:hypothetical protein